ncbi:hypothetical protein KSI01_29350 [Kurthia sibirica]|nr:hypothetical protein KSI01_29350 [Kurthia sibirica]
MKLLSTYDKILFLAITVTCVISWTFAGFVWTSVVLTILPIFIIASTIAKYKLIKWEEEANKNKDEET